MSSRGLPSFFVLVRCTYYYKKGPANRKLVLLDRLAFFLFFFKTRGRWVHRRQKKQKKIANLSKRRKVEVVIDLALHAAPAHPKPPNQHRGTTDWDLFWAFSVLVTATSSYLVARIATAIRLVNSTIFFFFFFFAL